MLDTEPGEHQRGESLRLSVGPVLYGDHLINVLDTPGYADFTGDALLGLWAADLAVFVIDGVTGVQTSDVLLWRTAARWRVPRMVFINKLDRGRASFDRALMEVRDRFGIGIEPVELPLGEESSFHGIADLLTEHAFLYDSGRAEEVADLPADIVDRERQLHEALVEAVTDDGADLLEIPADPAAHTVITTFATRADDYVGQISLFKVLSGTLRADDVLVNARTGDKDRLHGLVRVRGAHLEPVAELQAGDIGGVTKLSDLEAGDTLHDDGLPWRLRVPVPEPPQAVHGIGITPASSGEEDKFVIALAKVLREEASLRVERNEETHQTVVWGAGDVHVQVALERLQRRYGVAVTTEPVRIAYRETITRSVEVEARHKKQSGGRGQFAVAAGRGHGRPAAASWPRRGDPAGRRR